MTEVLLPRPGRGDPWRPGFSLPLERREEVLVGTLSFTDRLLVVAESCFSSPPPSHFLGTWKVRLGLHHLLLLPGIARAWHRAGSQQMSIE